MNKYLKDMGDELAYMPYAPRVFISAHTGQRVNRLLELIKTVNENHALRISTGVLNEVLIEATAMQQPPADKGRQLRLYYMTQVSETAYICHICKRKGTVPLFIPQIYGKPTEGSIWICRNAHSFYCERKRG